MRIPLVLEDNCVRTMLKNPANYWDATSLVYKSCCHSPFHHCQYQEPDMHHRAGVMRRDLFQNTMMQHQVTLALTIT